MRNNMTLGAALFFASIGFDTPLFAIDCGDTLGPGGIFTLTEDLVCSTEPALTIVGPVMVNFNRHSLTCDSASTGLRIQGSGATVRNGSIIRCPGGVSAEGDDNTVKGMNLDPAPMYVSGSCNRIVGNAVFGGEDGVFVSGDNNLLRGNVVTHTIEPMRVSGHDNQVLNNTVDGSLGGALYGIHVPGTGSLVKGNVVWATGAGIMVSANENQVDSNVTLQNSVGIAIESQDNTILANISLNNGIVDLTDANPDCDNNVWRRNIFRTAGEAAFPPTLPVPPSTCIR